MAKHSTNILELARKGAEHKYQELKAELAQLVKSFPHLADARRTVSRGAAAISRRGRAAAVALGEATLPKPKRRKMSAKARKAISDAQKRRWAAQKAAAASAAPASSKAGKKR
jgi:hypothetical protein